MSNNVAALPAGKSNFSLTPTTLAEAMEFAGVMAKSSIVPKDYQGNPGNILVAVQWGAELGLPPLQAMQSIAVINGRPSIWGDAMLALVRGSGLLEYIVEEPTETGCVCRIKRRGEPEVERSFTIEDAKRAGLAGKSGPWQQFPKRMLQMRARAFALRDVFPDVLRGVYVAEEAQDMPAERDMGKAEDVTPPKSRAERAKAAIADRRQAAATVPPVVVPAVADVLAAITAAATPDALAATAELAGQLPEADRAAARKAYKDRAEAIARAAAPADPETGELASDDHDDFLAAYEAAEQGGK
jgi:hypothetical protein